MMTHNFKHSSGKYRCCLSEQARLRKYPTLLETFPHRKQLTCWKHHYVQHAANPNYPGRRTAHKFYPEIFSKCYCSVWNRHKEIGTSPKSCTKQSKAMAVSLRDPKRATQSGDYPLTLQIQNTSLLFSSNIQIRYLSSFSSH